MEFTALTIDRLPLDVELTDGGCVGPELAHLARAYCRTPRALIWRNPSSDWPLLVLTLPIATRLTLLANPIFGRLVREWGHGIRFLGVDGEGFAYDFRDLLDAAALRRLIDALVRWLLARDAGPLQASGTAQADDGARPSADDPAITGAAGRSAADDAALDTVFDLLATEMLTVLERRRADWTIHLARDGVLATDDVDSAAFPAVLPVARTADPTRRPAFGPASLPRPPSGGASLFDRRARYPEFTALLRQALRNAMIDVEFYGRVLRAIDRREHDAESRIISIVESALDPITLGRLARTPIGIHLGCYNWLLQDPRARAHRAATLHKLPALAQFFADRMLAAATPSAREIMADRLVAQGIQGPAAEALLRAAGGAIDSGQDRAAIVALARYFHVSDNLIRTLWRNCPAALGAPPTWHLRQILRVLDQLPQRHWPVDRTGWAALKAQAVPASLAAG
ncbi:MAG: hypothetical protein ABWZ78_09475 [Burkholderiaceae bacterium]